MKVWLKQFNPLSAKGWQAQLAVGLVLLGAFFLLTAVAWQLYSSLRVTGVVEKVVKTVKLQKQAVVKKLTSKNKKPAIFGQFKPVAKERVNTDLILLGILKATNKQDSKAIIAKKGKDEDVYAIGDRIANGLNVYRIYEDRVVVTRYGAHETLYIKWENDGFNTSIRKTSSNIKRGQTFKRSSSPVRAEDMAERWKKLREMRGNLNPGSLQDLGGTNVDTEELKDKLKQMRGRFNMESMRGLDGNLDPAELKEMMQQMRQNGKGQRRGGFGNDRSL